MKTVVVSSANLSLLKAFESELESKGFKATSNVRNAEDRIRVTDDKTFGRTTEDFQYSLPTQWENAIKAVDELVKIEDFPKNFTFEFGSHKCSVKNGIVTIDTDNMRVVEFKPLFDRLFNESNVVKVGSYQVINGSDDNVIKIGCKTGNLGQTKTALSQLALGYPDVFGIELV